MQSPEGSGEPAAAALDRGAPSPAELLGGVPVRVRWFVAGALTLASLAYAFLSLRAPVRFWNDFAFIYAAGRAWLEGSYPYDFDVWNAEWAAIRPPDTEVSQPMPFMYPPYWAPLAIAFASVPWAVASRLWDAVNVVAFFALCALCLELGPTRLRGALQKPEVWIFVALAGFNPALHYAVWQSQMSVVSTFGIVGTFWAFKEKKPIWLAVFAFVAALKPQVGLAPLAFVLVNGGYVGILAAAGVALVLSAVALLPHAHELPTHLARIYQLHMQLKFNAPHEFANWPAVVAPHLPGGAFMMLGVLSAAAAVAYATRLRRQNPNLASDGLLQLGLLVSIAGAFMPVHAYDLVIYCPIAILAYQYRSQWIGMLLAVFVLVAGRAHVFADYFHIRVHGGYLTTLLAFVLFYLASRAAEPKGAR